MLVSITGWKTKGLRCPDTEVSLLDNNKIRKINLIQMPNGTGKSTIIELISAALTGTARYWSAEKITQFQNLQLANDTGQFILSLLIDDNDKNTSKKVVFQLDFDFVSNTVDHSTNKDANIGLEIGWKAPKELVSFLNDKCVEVFVFKGDKVRKLIEKGRTDAESSIKAFFGLSHMDQIYHLIEEDFSSRQSGVKTDKGLGQKESILVNWKKWLASLEKEKKRIEKELEPVRASFDDIETKVEAILSGQDQNNQIRLEYEQEKDELKEKLSLATKDAFDVLKNPFFISTNISHSMNALRDNLDHMKLPGTSGEFFKELVQGANCICGAVLNDESKNHILRNAESYLSDDHIEIINGIKKDIKSYTKSAEEQKRIDPFKNLASINSEYYLAEQRLQNHLTKMKEEASAQQHTLISDFKKVSKEKDELERKLNILLSENGDFRQFLKRDPKECKKIPIVEAVIKAKDKELSQIKGTVEEFNAKEKLKRILENSSDIALNNIKNELKDKSNNKLQKILTEGTPLKILEIDKHIQLGFDGKLQESASGGQNVSVAYSFATSILERSGAQFPLIVDHPVTALQESSRRGLGKKLSEICHQFIGFIIDTEKPGFVDSLSAIEDDSIFITLFKKITGNEPYLTLLPDNPDVVFHSDNGIVCTDKDFFKNFKDLTPDGSE